jgi:hypothetical protein
MYSIHLYVPYTFVKITLEGRYYFCSSLGVFGTYSRSWYIPDESGLEDMTESV